MSAVGSQEASLVLLFNKAYIISITYLARATITSNSHGNHGHCDISVLSGKPAVQDDRQLTNIMYRLSISDYLPAVFQIAGVTNNRNAP